MKRPHAFVGVALVVLGPGLWASHLLVSYALVPFSCRIGSDLPLHLVTLLGVVGTVVTSTVALKAVRTGNSRSLANWFMVSGEAPRVRGDDRQTLFLLSASMATYFAIVVVMTGLVPVVVNRCA